ncbi:MAG: hypothetical protein OXK77_07145 [Gemmatimonadota bacterium]|nr:hypothetical protein [Gemmatimonadota bacterium]MDE2864589.1 hypothetical protein [Gemmatimonadota bacterium]MXV95457.1 hypothetical protein [Gemmatimonadota bacterium]MYB08012.1 hypothetical protein [Gemmatimonadota bacterium]MYE16472.1 hypothetical protein [Gemmatimonadota bacterium]
MRAFLLLTAAAVAATLAPSRAGAQEVGRSPLELVEYWNGVYDAAYRRYEAAAAEFRVLEENWNRLIDERLQQVESNPARAERILGEILSLSTERTIAQGQVRVETEEWEQVGDSFIGALDNYLEILNNTIRGTPLGDSLDESISLYNFWHERLEEVERQLAPNLLLVLEPMPEVVARDDDTAEDLERKATLLENRALRDSAGVVEIEEKIATDRRRLERDRSTADLSARIRRFGDMTIPVVPTTEGGPEIVGDTTAADRTQTPEQRIELMEAYRDEMIARVELLLERARELRAEAARRRM